MAEEKQESRLAPVSSQYRTAAGLPERESDSPTALHEAALEKRYEPEGGYGGQEGTNTAAINATEQQRAEQRDAQQEQRDAQLEETGLTGGETATQEAIVTGEPVVDEKPEPGFTPEAEVVEPDGGTPADDTREEN